MEAPKQPTITSANLPKPPIGGQQAPQVAKAAAPPTAQLPVYDSSIIKAVPLADPDFSNLRPKNPMHRLYWSNRGYQNGFRVNYRQAQGFRLARKEDLANLPLDEHGNSYMCDPSGAIINGDLVLMIIGKNAYEGALLHNHNQAIRRGSRFGQVHQNWKTGPNGELVPVGEPTDVVRATIDETRASPMQKAKIRAFVPGAAELEGMLGDASVPEKP